MKETGGQEVKDNRERLYKMIELCPQSMQS
jgi:hypothetical protein